MRRLSERLDDKTDALERRKKAWNASVRLSGGGRDRLMSNRRTRTIPALSVCASALGTFGGAEKRCSSRGDSEMLPFRRKGDLRASSDGRKENVCNRERKRRCCFPVTKGKGLCTYETS